MSAGTVLAMSGDEILMDYHSCLGPIDPQLERDDHLVPALSYLAQYEHLIEKSMNGALSTAELVLLNKPVTKKMKEERASKIAHQLSDQKRWLTHGRGIDMKTLRDELRLRIDDFGANPDLKKAVWDYFWFLRDHMRINRIESFVHAHNLF